MTARLTVYSPVLVTMPARMEGHAEAGLQQGRDGPGRRRPAAMARNRPRMGWPATAAVADTAQPSVNAPVGGHIRDIEHAEAQKQRQRNERVDAAQLQGALQDGE